MLHPRVATPRISGLEVLRGYAAVAVILLHTEALGFHFHAGITQSVISAIGACGVPLFFALSAFSLLYGYGSRIFDDRTALRFYTRRAFRICPLFYAMIVAWILFGRKVTWPEIALNLTFLFPHEGKSIVFAGWSLAIEWVFYWTFPIFALLARSASASTITFVTFVIVNLATRQVMPELGFSSSQVRQSVFRNLVFFQTGVLAFRLRGLYEHRLPKARAAAIVVACVVVPALMAALTRATPSDMVIVAVCGVVLACAFSGLPHWIDNAVSGYMGRVSYSLYLLHPLIILLLDLAGVYGYVKATFGSLHLGLIVSCLLTVGVTAAAAWVTYHVIEAPAIAFGDRLLTRSPRAAVREQW